MGERANDGAINVEHLTKSLNTTFAFLCTAKSFIKATRKQKRQKLSQYYEKKKAKGIVKVACKKYGMLSRKNSMPVVKRASKKGFLCSPGMGSSEGNR